MARTKPSPIIVMQNGISQIHLRNCREPAIVDTNTLRLIAGWRFYMNWVNKKNNEGWVRGYRNGERAYLHRLLTNAQYGKVVDHVDGNTLNNRMSNLRIVTVSENGKNRGKKRHYLNGKGGITVEANKLIRVVLQNVFGFRIEKLFFNTDEALKGKKRALSAKDVSEAMEIFSFDGWSVECRNCFDASEKVMKCRKCGSFCCISCSHGGVCESCLVEEQICY